MVRSNRKEGERPRVCVAVTVNGKPLAVAGIPGRGGVTASVSTWSPSTGSVLKKGAASRVSMRVGGTDRNDPTWDRFYVWPSPRLRVGDEVTFRVVGPARPDRSKFMTRLKRIDVDQMPAPENPTYTRMRNVSVWIDRRAVLLRASDKGNAPRLTAKAARKAAKALERAADQLERRQSKE